MLETFHDPRIKYCRLDSNKGQDINILNAFRNCDAPYAFLLRTKDTVIPEKIPTMIEQVYASPDVGYWRFACVNENGQSWGVLPAKVFRRGPEAAQGQARLMVHPSGELYNLSFFSGDDFRTLEDYLTRYFSDHLGFVAHTLMRMKLSACSAVATSGEYTWVLLSNEASAKGTVNTTSNKRSIYAPEYQYPRYRCEMDYVARELPEEIRETLHRTVIRRYCQSITVVYKYINQNALEQQHYQFDRQPFSISQERRTFYKETMELIQNYPSAEKRRLKRYTLFCLTVMQLRWEASRVLGPLIKVRLIGGLSDILRKRHA